MTLIQSSVNYSPERLAYWYFRLNGFLTTENFIVHPDAGRDQRTDADLLAVRFAHRAENLSRPMVDHPQVVSCATLINVIMVEVKTGRCSLNGPWTNPSEENMHRVLSAIGCLPQSEISRVSGELHIKGCWSDAPVTVRLFALGETTDHRLPISISQQLTWTEVISFCIQRFQDYRHEKLSVGQWTEDGRKLKDLARRRNAQANIRQIFGLRPLAQTTQGAI